MTSQFNEFLKKNDLAIESQDSEGLSSYPADYTASNRLEQIRSRIQSGYYSQENVLTDISDKLGSILGDYD